MEIKGLNQQERQAIKKFIEGLKNLYNENLYRVILYGSKARGEATVDSDIDVMVILKKQERRDKEFKKIARIVNPICLEYDLLISTVVKNKEEYLVRKSPLLLNVRKEGVNL